MRSALRLQGSPCYTAMLWLLVFGVCLFHYVFLVAEGSVKVLSRMLQPNAKAVIKLRCVM